MIMFAFEINFNAVRATRKFVLCILRPSHNSLEIPGAFIACNSGQTNIFLTSQDCKIMEKSLFGRGGFKAVRGIIQRALKRL